MKQISITALVFSRTSVTSVAMPIEILTIAANAIGGTAPHVNVIFPTNPQMMGSANDLFVDADAAVRNTLPYSLHHGRQPDIILIGSLGFPEWGSQYCSQEMIEWLKVMDEKNVPIVSICSGTFLLAKAGLLQAGATIHPHFSAEFQQLFPHIPLYCDKKVINDNHRFCISNAYGGGSCMLNVVELIYGQYAREQCAKFLLGENDSKNPSDLVNFTPYRQHGDLLIHKLQDWMHASPSEILSVADLANKIHLCERQMKRRFKIATGKTPIQYIQQIRMSQAKHWLEKSQKTIEEISHEVGYEDTRYFRELFKRCNGLTPKEYRQKYHF
ncbi:two-component response regulator [Xenorhabdus mauleonii]|uniref:Transcriptional regulator, AraC family with amidase-like domain n=1 Tax=Xenorhabdus mauleonii TaxID=351675 RepID=A0A1I3IHN3_9GAMM|nr:helix-turn-helix domain-containing protein [Xenorhabdus mauleonii]PHM39505.1 two-component response regulator [Xenorhabdus mauleonii]SFI47400.1 transcriptional regulator, AraC family with amidase-like domain [Xenorhabdus mauleonii]